MSSRQTEDIRDGQEGGSRRRSLGLPSPASVREIISFPRFSLTPRNNDIHLDPYSDRQSLRATTNANHNGSSQSILINEGRSASQIDGASTQEIPGQTAQQIVTTPAPSQGSVTRPESPQAQARNFSLRRELQQSHIFCISIGAVIGMGYYIRTGIVEALGGQGAVLLAYVVLGMLAFAIMQDQARLLHVWPIRGALVAFVEAFVDREVAQIVGVLYWLTYCFSFAGLTTTVGTLVDDLHLPKLVSIVLSVIFVILPILANLADIRCLKFVELVCGYFKIVMTIGVNIAMMVINKKVAAPSSKLLHRRDVVFHNTGPAGWFGTICIAVFTTSFAFVGIEAVAATAIEVDFRKYTPSVSIFNASFDPADQQVVEEQARETRAQEEADVAENASFTPTNQQEVEGQARNPQAQEEADMAEESPFSLPALLVPLVTTLLYLWGGWIVTENVAWNNTDLPTLPGHPSPESSSIGNSTTGNSTIGNLSAGHLITSNSIFGIAAASSSPALGKVFTWFLLVNVVSTSSTALYIASRTLYGLGVSHSALSDGAKRRGRISNILTWKNKFHVPQVAVLASSIWPAVIAFMKYKFPQRIEQIIACVIEAGSISCILVWGCEQLAAGRLYHCLRNNTAHLTPPLRKHIPATDKSWYRRQVTISFASAFACFAIVIGGGITTCYYTKDPWQIGALAGICGLFLIGTIVLKAVKLCCGRKNVRLLANLKDNDALNILFGNLPEKRKGNLESLPRPPLSIYDCLGINFWSKPTYKQLHAAAGASQQMTTNI